MKRLLIPVAVICIAFAAWADALAQRPNQNQNKKADARKKLQLDLWYIKHMSIELDLIILLRTLGTVFLGSR